jgi:demethylmenaquinone methyltransferase/2-methoxy-6-polyprenyl-1,4-benzoquinol methylase
MTPPSKPGEPAIDPGARPANESTEHAAAAHVRGIFNSIAPSYDRLNHLLSFGLDRRWWNKTAHAFAPILTRPEARVLDLCCGTGDMTAALLKFRPKSQHKPGSTSFDPQRQPVAPAIDSEARGSQAAHTTPIAQVTGLDFSAEMLDCARAKFPASQHNVLWVEADAMHLPYPDDTFDLITAAFGFRNLTHYAAGLAELHRVLRPGGSLGILEANQPDGFSGALYTLYFRHILPLIGGLLSGDRAAYRYLPASVARFPRPPQMLALLREAGFHHACWDGYLLRAAGLYRAVKPAPALIPGTHP